MFAQCRPCSHARHFLHPNNEFGVLRHELYVFERFCQFTLSENFTNPRFRCSGCYEAKVSLVTKHHISVLCLELMNKESKTRQASKRDVYEGLKTQRRTWETLTLTLENSIIGGDRQRFVFNRHSLCKSAIS